jgi:hypothetical protein
VNPLSVVGRRGSPCPPCHIEKLVSSSTCGETAHFALETSPETRRSYASLFNPTRSHAQIIAWSRRSSTRMCERVPLYRRRCLDPPRTQRRRSSGCSSSIRGGSGERWHDLAREALDLVGRGSTGQNTSVSKPSTANRLILRACSFAAPKLGSCHNFQGQGVRCCQSPSWPGSPSSVRSARRT